MYHNVHHIEVLKEFSSKLSKASKLVRHDSEFKERTQTKKTQ